MFLTLSISVLLSGCKSPSQVTVDRSLLQLLLYLSWPKNREAYGLTKIGSFIAKCRKEKKSTQKQITNAPHSPNSWRFKIGKWKSWPDPSMSVIRNHTNRLLSGQHLNSETCRQQDEKSMDALFFSQEQLFKICFASSLLLTRVITLYFFPLGTNSQSLPFLTKCGFYFIGVFVWRIALYIQLKIDQVKIKKR